MKENMEQLNKQKGQEQEKSVIERLKEIKAKEEALKKEDPTHGTPWGTIIPENLIQSALDLFDLYEKGEIEAAKEEIRVVRNKTEKIKKKDIKESNEQFINWIDDKIIGAFNQKERNESQL